jgi:hypothetical protein
MHVRYTKNCAFDGFSRDLVPHPIYVNACSLFISLSLSLSLTLSLFFFCPRYLKAVMQKNAFFAGFDLI